MARPYGIVPRNTLEEVAWPALRGKIFAEASEIFLRLLRGDIVSSEMIGNTILTRENFRSDEDWSKVQNEACKHFGLESVPDSIDMGNRYEFEEIKIIPQNWDRGLLNLILAVTTRIFRERSISGYQCRFSISQ